MKLTIKVKLELTKADRDDLKYALAILSLNQNTHGDKESDAQSVRAYRLVKNIIAELK